MPLGYRAGTTVVLALAAIFHSPTTYSRQDINSASIPTETAAEPDEPPAGLTRADWSQIRRSIQASEYHASRAAKPGEPPVLHAPNRKQGYRTTFRREGIEIVPQAPTGASWRLGLSVTGYGYEGDIRPVDPADPQAAKEKVEYRHGPLTQWYLNRPGGLEQGFELNEPRSRRPGPLVIAMAVRSDLSVAASDDGASFAEGSGRTLVRYAGLKAWDAQGRPLQSRLEAGERELRLVVEAQAARFPVSIDPTFLHEAQIFGHDDPIGETNSRFGSSVSVSADTAVVGAPLSDTPVGADRGSAYVFVRSGTTWTEQQKLFASDGGVNDGFGSSVSISGDTAVVGAPADDPLGGVNAGSAYVFVRSGATWTQQQKLLASDGAASDQFGISVSVSADTAVVGAAFGDGPGGSVGSAYVYVRAGTTWSEQQKLLASDGAFADQFGVAVAVSGDTVAVGAAYADTAGGMDAGSAYVFVRSGTTWSEQQKLLASDGAATDIFGYSLSLSGDTAVVAAYLDDTLAGADAGSAYVFVRSGTTWSEQQKLVASDGAASDLFGRGVSLSGDTAVIGAVFDDTAGGPGAGSVYVFVRSGTTWSEEQKLLASDGAASDFFGVAVAVSGDTAVLGAYLDDVPTFEAGSAYVFVRSGTTWSEQQKLLASDAVLSDRFGFSVSVSGDTAVVGAPLDESPGGTNAGSAYVFVRSGTTWSEQQKLLASDGAVHDQFGISVSVSGDTAVVGAHADDTLGGTDAGSAHVFVRSGTTWTEQQTLLASDATTSGDRFGISVSVSGDTAVVGAYRDDTPGDAAGSAYVFVRSGTTWTEQQKLLASDGAVFDQFGISVSVSGDTAVVGTLAGGSAYVFVRSGTTWTEQQKLVASDGAANDHFGVSVSVSGDTALVGAYSDDTPGGEDAGSAYVFVRSGTTWTEQQRLLASDGAVNDAFGISVSVSGDTALVGAYADDTAGATDAGSGYVFVRSGPTWSERQKLLAPDGAANDSFGISVSFSGDTAVVGAYRDDTVGGADAGSAHVFRAQAADLGVTKTDGQTTAVPGHPLTYTIAVSNAGPSDVTGATVTDVLPAALLAPTWTCAASPGSNCTASGSGNINDTVDLLASGSATYTVTGTVDPAATGTLTNTATVAGTIDPEPADNSATDTDTLTPEGDLAITKTDGQTTAIPGLPLTYTIAASNSGPSNAPVAVVADDFTSELIGVTWTCVGTGGATCAASGAGDLSTLVNLPAGGTVTFTATGTLDPSATGTLLNNCSVGPFPGVTDPNPSNNSAFDFDTLEPQADLAITKTDGQTTAIPGQPIVYTIVASNSGPSNAMNATVFDAFPAAITGLTWTCVSTGGANCAPSGSGGINAPVFLPKGGTVTFTATGTIDPAATGTLSNTATVTAPAGVTETNPANNSATDTDTLTPEADVSITKTDGQTTAVPGQTVTYTIVASNAGPSDSPGATVADAFPAALSGVTWTCVAAGGASCAAGGSGSINDTVNLPVGGTATYAATGTIDPAATGTLSNTASVTAPGGLTDPDPSNNTANDTDTLTPEADLVMVKVDSADPVSPGDPLTYTLTITNAGPSDATAVAVVDTLPGGVTFVSSTPGPPVCTIGGSTLSCALGSLASGGNATVTIDVIVNDPQGPGVLVNTATASASETDPDPANNTDSETTNVSGARAELAHGSDFLFDLGAQPGPAATEHVFLISQSPFSSYEVVVDSTSGDIGVGAGPVLERVGADGTTVLQVSSAVGTGPSRSLRWRNATSATVQGETVRVRSAQCGTDCGPDDVYRVRTYETTYSVPRFNNFGTQLTVLVLQNPTNYPISGEAYFQVPTGVLVASHAFTLNPKATLVLNTSTVPGANGVSGAVTVAHDGRYGDLAGKTVALEPATGFSFDSALTPRPRNAFR